MDITLDR